MKFGNKDITQVWTNRNGVKTQVQEIWTKKNNHLTQLYPFFYQKHNNSYGLGFCCNRHCDYIQGCSCGYIGYIDHVYKNGKCEICGLTCTHVEDHNPGGTPTSAVDAQGYCEICGIFTCDHTFNYWGAGEHKCTKCGFIEDCEWPGYSADNTEHFILCKI